MAKTTPFLLILISIRDGEMEGGRFGGPERVEHSVRERPGSARQRQKKPTRMSGNGRTPKNAEKN